MAKLMLTGADLNNQRAVNVADPTSATDAATKQYVDAVAKGIDWKDPVRVATTTNGALASAYENGDTVDGIVLATGDRILLKDQTAPAENGIYVVQASGAPVRATDANENAEVTNGMAVAVLAGTVNGPASGVYKAFVLTTTGAITIGTTSLTFGQLGGGAGTSYVGGAGLTLTGATFDVVAGGTPSSGGPGGGLVVAADSIAVDTNVVVRKFAANLGDGSSTSFNIDHNFGTKDVTYAIQRVSDGVMVDADVTASTVNRLVVVFASAPTSGQYRITVHA